jgi:hypothetical protein
VVGSAKPFQIGWVVNDGTKDHRLPFILALTSTKCRPASSVT